MKLTTEAELADELGITPERAARLRREKGWPHISLGRNDKRYTEDQKAEVLAIMTRVHGRRRDASGVMGQTARSRRASA